MCATLTFHVQHIIFKLLNFQIFNNVLQAITQFDKEYMFNNHKGTI